MTSAASGVINKKSTSNVFNQGAFIILSSIRVGQHLHLFSKLPITFLWRKKILNGRCPHFSPNDHKQIHSRRSCLSSVIVVMTAQRMTNRYFIISSWKGLRHPAARQLVSVKFRRLHPKTAKWRMQITPWPRKMDYVKLSPHCYEGGVANAQIAGWGLCLLDIWRSETLVNSVLKISITIGPTMDQPI